MLNISPVELFNEDLDEADNAEVIRVTGYAEILADGGTAMELALRVS